MRGSGPKLSLNGLRVFEAAARLRSLKAAAAELGVTQSAVSHQVRELERHLRASLFVRRHKGVDLTDEGARLFGSIGAAIHTISRAQEAIRTDANHVTLRVTASFAYRWLIPRLRMFRRDYPKITFRLDTSRVPHVIEAGVDIAIQYRRRGMMEPGMQVLLEDQVRLVASPTLLARFDKLRQAPVVDALPLLSATEDDWDWREWAAVQGIAFARLKIADRFDVDHAALEACVAGIGVFLASEPLIRREKRSGALTMLHQYEAVHLGDYGMQVTRPCRDPVQLLAAWLSRPATRDDGAAVES